MDEQTRREKIGQTRGAIGLVLAGIWIVYWWMKFDVEKNAALANCHGGNWIENVGQGMCEGKAQGVFGGQIFLVVIVAPLAFWIAHYIAKFIIDQRASGEASRRARIEHARHREHQQTLAELGNEAKQQSQIDRDENDRHEVISRLGAVDDQLIVLETETEQSRITRIKMSISQALREIDAKFTDARLQELMAAHGNIKTRVERTMREMKRLGLERSREFEDLAGMFGYGGTSEAERSEAAEIAQSEPSSA